MILNRIEIFINLYNNIVIFLAYEVIVSFTSDRPGVYEQWLVFDFDMRPVLLQKLKVRVGMVDPSRLCPQPLKNQGNKETQQGTDSSIKYLESENTQHTEQLPVLWHEKNVEIVPYHKQSEAHQELLKKYSHVTGLDCGSVMISTDLINQQNYKEKMHSFLYLEEKTQDEVVSRYIFTTLYNNSLCSLGHQMVFAIVNE